MELKEYINTDKFRSAFVIPKGMELTITPLAQGEYHKNYVFVHPVSQAKYVLRENYGSQMHLEHQIEYEYEALCQLKASGRTPVPVYVDGTKEQLEHGILVMEFIEGVPLSYEKDLLEGAKCLADVHATRIADPTKLIEIESPIFGILKECEEMFAVYKESDVAKPDKVAKIEELMAMAYQKAKVLTDNSYENVCINTELNNYNFLVNEESGRVSLIDWEKPLWGDPAQDIGHMLAPTTSFWRTDVILEDTVIEQFIDQYIESIDGRIELGKLRDRVHVFLPVTCLRGITWCAMAYVEYCQPGRDIVNPDTFEKLKAYQSDAYLARIKAYLEK